MARYFFDITGIDTLIPDEEGSELDGLRAAQTEAVGILHDIAKGLEAHGTRQTFVVSARNTTGKLVFQATLSLNFAWL